MNSTAMLAVVLFAAASPLAAQQSAPAGDGADAPAAPADIAPQTPQTAEDEAGRADSLPQILQGDGFSDVTTRQGRRGGTLVQGVIAGTGKDFDAMLGPDGALRGIRTAEGSSLPDEVIGEMLLEAVRAHPVTAEIAELSAIGTRGEAVMLAGQDASGDAVRIGFDAAGELVHFSRGDDRMGPGGRGDEMGRDKKRGDGARHGGRTRDGWSRDGGPGDGERRGGGPRDGEPRGGDPRDGGPRDGGPRGDGPRDGAAVRPSPDQGGAPSEEAALRGEIESAGYTALGRFVPASDGATLDATNPQGEPVTLRLNPQGEVVEETAR
ncbi:hypothetical protein SAMN05421538_105186 [Paracoccus isoporae]|uniref:Peptidase propeptide and YPEB domain-containing protein n=2 Tax=Paracoccus isoporae TaxID=591205 RepID=A0A1G7BS76_9RHOB|nr:hypothetical protein SAMN05421538_105186 [Paracoccus isoporae]